MRFRSLCRSPQPQHPYFMGDSATLSRSRKPVRVFRSDEGSNPSLSAGGLTRSSEPVLTCVRWVELAFAGAHVGQCRSLRPLGRQ